MNRPGRSAPPGCRRAGFSAFALLFGVIAGMLLAQSGGAVDGLEVQTIALQPGWNAIHLKVDPLEPHPGAVFTNLPVTKVAAYFPNRTPVEFIQDPAAVAWKKQGWNVWFAPTLPESVVSDLSAMSGGQAYLVYATAGATVPVQGRVRYRRIRWRSDSYNFVGFPVEAVAGPTFAAWFAGSPAHRSAARPMIFTLDGGGHWRPVDRPESTLVQANTAYWVFCQGASDYQGPLDVSVPLGVQSSGVDFGTANETITVRFRNTTASPLRFSVELSPAAALPLSYEQKLLSLGQRVQIPLTSPASLGPLEAGSELNLRLLLDRALLVGTNGGAVLTVRDDVGGLVRMPVTGRLP